MKLVWLIKMCLNETHGKVRTDSFLIQNCLEPLLFNFVSEYASGKVGENQVGLILNGTHQLLAYADDLIYWEIA
jgi:hypothetical protein